MMLKDFFDKLKLNKILIVILVVAAVFRFYQLGLVPGSLNQDEAAIGYNAYSLYKTGADEHGNVFPLSLKSFGDWKLPVYPLVTIPFIAVFDLNEFSVRMPSAISGIVGVLLIYKITLLLFKNRRTSLFAAFFFAVSSWSVYLSRAAYEVNLGTALFMAGFYFLLLFLKNKSSSVNLILASIFFSLTLFTYHSFILFTPLFIFGTVIINYKKWRIDKNIIISFILTSIFVSVSFFNIINSASDKVSTLSIFNDPTVVYNRALFLRDDGDLINKLLYNKYYSVAYQFGQNYIGVLSPEFLFDKGGEKLQHNLGHIGNFYLIDSLLLVFGLLSVFWHREKSILFLVPWILVGPIPSALTVDTPNTTRLFLLFPVGVVFMAYGASRITTIFLKRKLFVPLLIIVSGLYVISIVYFIDGYFNHFNQQRLRYWRYGERQVVDISKNHPKHEISVRVPEDFHYIYFLFYLKYDPVKFREEVKYYPQTKEGFLYVKSFGRYSFVKSIDYNNLKMNTVYFDSIDPQNSPYTINLPTGEPILGYTIVDEKK